MAQGPAHSYVFATDFRIPDPQQVGPLLGRHRESLLDLGATYVFAYESIIEPGRVLVIVGVRSEQPLLSLLRSRYFFDWFDAVGIDDIPAVFAGHAVERFDVIDPAPASNGDIVVVAVTPADDVDVFIVQVRASLRDFARAGIQTTLVYRAFDSPREVMFLQRLGSADNARRWVQRSDVAAEWLAAAGVGVYPPVFVGRLAHSVRLEHTSGTATR